MDSNLGGSINEELSASFLDLTSNVVQSDEACELCRKLSVVFQAVSDFETQKIIREPISREWATIENLRQVSRCCVHRTLLRAILENSVSRNPDEVVDLSLGLRVDENAQYTDAEARVGFVEVGNVYGLKTELWPRPLSKLQSIYDQQLNAQWIDPLILQSWEVSCTCWTKVRQVYHSHTKMDNSAEGQTRWLVDVNNRCLVPADHQSYVALSYTWDRSQNFMATAKDLARLRTPFALDANYEQLAPTIRFAIELVKLLGKKYIWVDQLCIFQDDDKHKRIEIQSMTSIYENAAFTIIAAHTVGDRCGIKGLRGITGPRKLNQERYIIGAHRFTYPPCRKYSSEPSKWAARGWTMQEDVFSRARLVFVDETVYWECECLGCRYEDIPDKASIQIKPREIVIGVEREDNSWENLHSMISRNEPNTVNLQSLINVYNTRQLTFAQDALYACAGLLNSMRASFPGGFISGLPKDFFDIALLWTSLADITRRQPDAGSYSNCFLPSWSWAGWKGEITFQALLRIASPRGPDRYSIYTSMFLERVTATQTWSYRTNTGEWNTIPCRWLESHDQYYESSSKEPPPGWQRIVAEDTLEEIPWFYQNIEHLPRYFYRHDNFPRMNCYFPISGPEEGRVQESNVMAREIRCRTNRAYMYKGYVLSSGDASILDREGGWAGAFIDRAIDASNSRKLEDGEIIELVQIAKGVRKEKYPYFSMSDKLVWPEWRQKARPIRGKWYEFYWVLRIDWENGIAYRRGIGRVVAQIWEAQDLEMIDLILG
ncbi:HET-domain-containing protein [Pseudovirgaria hyperparasitica]|uniref:HET-domain-containing protein n=1 Tax=Pseudovirgaria hyperparasitica TaxID=470096 RepID=A0A6A6WJN8_9PEZI|nr:HET-domain-containing protein [Pseudovirgaria hyperparasitica]KAF2762495.1 HET-domain-containing protein [Pseudovirgaria hyperparasitica]